MKTLPQPWSAAMEATMFTGASDLWMGSCIRCARRSTGRR
jgi:hypothetical protein